MKKVDKRTKEYKDSQKALKEMNDTIIPEPIDNASEGLGDTLEKVFEATGITKMVEWLANGKDCGCEERKELLNEMFRYKPNCLVKSEYDYLVDYMKRHNSIRFDKQDVFTLTRMYHRVFNRKIKICMNCKSAFSTMEGVVNDFRKVIELYKEENDDTI